MAFYKRTIGNNLYLYETRRIDGKVVQQYLGEANTPSLVFLRRTDDLHQGMRKRNREEVRRTVRDSDAIEEVLRVIDLYLRRIPTIRNMSDLKFKQPVKQSTTKRSGSSFDPSDMAVVVKRIPVEKAFRRLHRAAKGGDADAAKKLAKAVATSEDLLASFSDFVAMARWMVLQQFAQADSVVRQSMEAKFESFQSLLQKSTPDDPALEMMAEILVVAYMDAMRCALLAAHRYDNKSDAVHFQRLADRSAARYAKLQETFAAECAQRHTPQT